MRFIERIKKKGVTASSHARFKNRVNSTVPRARARVNVTACVKGRKSWEKTCTEFGKAVVGKKVPLTRNMGVMNRKAG